MRSEKKNFVVLPSFFSCIFFLGTNYFIWCFPFFRLPSKNAVEFLGRLKVLPLLNSFLSACVRYHHFLLLLCVVLLCLALACSFFSLSVARLCLLLFTLSLLLVSYSYVWRCLLYLSSQRLTAMLVAACFISPFSAGLGSVAVGRAKDTELDKRK